MKLLTFSMVLLLHCLAFGQQKILIPFRDSKGLHGYLNVQGEVVIPAKYTHAHNFCPEGYAFVVETIVPERSGPPRPGGPAAESVWKVIDSHGAEISLPLSDFRPVSQRSEYGNNRGFENGLVILRVGEQETVVTTEFKELYDRRFDNINPFSEDGYALALDAGKWVILSKDGSYHYMQSEGLKPDYTEGELIRVMETNSGNSNFGFVNMKGEVVIAPSFNKAGDFKGLSVTWARSATAPHKIGIINTKGEWVLEPTFSYMFDFDEDAQATVAKIPDAMTSHIDQYKILHASGEVISMPDSVYELFKFNEGLAIFKLDDRNGKIGYMNNRGEVVIPAIYDAGHDFEDGIAFVSIGNNWGAINTKGEVVVPIQYAAVKDRHDGFVVTRGKRTFGFYDYQNGVEIPAIYPNANLFKSGYATVEDPKTGKWGLLDGKGNWKLEPKYEMLFFATEIVE